MKHENRVSDKLRDIPETADFPAQLAPPRVAVHEFPYAPEFVHIIDKMTRKLNSPALLVHEFAEQIVLRKNILTLLNPPSCSKSPFLMSIDLPDNARHLQQAVKHTDTAEDKGIEVQVLEHCPQ